MFGLIPRVYAKVDIETEFKLGEGAGALTLAGKSLASFISPLISNVFVLAGVIFFVLLVFGGITYILNAGSGDKEGVEKGKNALTSAILGFIIIFAAYWIISIIQYVTGINIFRSGL